MGTTEPQSRASSGGWHHGAAGDLRPRFPRAWSGTSYTSMTWGACEKYTFQALIPEKIHWIEYLLRWNSKIYILNEIPKSLMLLKPEKHWFIHSDSLILYPLRAPLVCLHPLSQWSRCMHMHKYKQLSWEALIL